MEKRVVVIGACGYVGSAATRMFERAGIEVVKVDPALKDKSATRDQANVCDLAVIAVPTGMSKKEGFPYPADTSIVEATVGWVETPLIMIKSTVPPGTTERLRKETGKRIVMSPEYIGEGKYYMPPHLDFSHDMEKTPFWIVGGDSQDVAAVYDVLTEILGPLKRYITVTATEAEVIKYWENTSLAIKVIMANEMRRTCEALGVNYYAVREGWLADPRMEYFHTLAFKDSVGFGGKCIPKDLNAFARACMDAGYEPDFILATLRYNQDIRDERGLDVQYDVNDIRVDGVEQTPDGPSSPDPEKYYY
jgi:nucleotide sugar dehydrogenase